MNSRTAMLVCAGVALCATLSVAQPAGSPTLAWETAGPYAKIGSVAISPDGETIVTGSGDKTIRVWRAVDGSMVRTLTGHTGAVNSVAISPDGNAIVSAGSVGDSTIKVWDLSSGTLLRTFPVPGSSDEGYGYAAECVAMSTVGTIIVSGGADNSVKLWSFLDGALLETLVAYVASYTGLYEVAITPDGGTVLSIDTNQRLAAWRVADGTLLHLIDTGHTGYGGTIALTPDGNTAVSGGGDKKIRIWSISDGSLLRTLPVSSDGDIAHWPAVGKVRISSDGGTIVSSGGAEIKVWNFASGVLLRTLPLPQHAPHSLAISTDGGYIVSGTDAGTLVAWRVDPPFSQWPSSVETAVTALPARPELLQNTPNPFNPSTTIPYGLPQDADVRLRVFSVTGKAVRTLVDRSMNAGGHGVVWDGRDDSGVPVGSGVYLYRLEVWGELDSNSPTNRREAAVRRMTLVR